MSEIENTVENETKPAQPIEVIGNLSITFGCPCGLSLTTLEPKQVIAVMQGGGLLVECGQCHARLAVRSPARSPAASRIVSPTAPGLPQKQLVSLR